MAIQTSSHKVLSPKFYLPVRHTNIGSAFHLSRASVAKFFVTPTAKSFCSNRYQDNGSFLKSRVMRPVVATNKASSGDKQEDGRYKNTVDLPRTTFGMRANSAVREPEIQKLWDAEQVLKKVVDRNSGGVFILHDGPPYANGDLHIGHALNKILKDIINRYKLLQNYKVHYVPGWDCHVLQSMDSDARKELTPLKLRKKAAKFAKDTVMTQMKSFKRYGVWGDWENAYLTLSPEYEAAQIEVFGKMALEGHIYRGRKPVHWSPSSRTALAEAELEYPEVHVSQSIYAIFKVTHVPDASLDFFKEFLPDVSLAIWTTTPWTIPGNAAVAVNPVLLYAIAEVHPLVEDNVTSKTSNTILSKTLRSGHQKLFVVVASDLVSTLETKWGVKLTIKKTLLGSVLENCRYIHPVGGTECSVVLGEGYITTESGTGLVHTAPGHGQEDYITGVKYGLPIFSPVDDNGKFTDEAGQFSGLDVLGDGNTAIIRFLDEKMLLMKHEPYKHKYPYDWRTKKPTIFRATEQWFASVEGFRRDAMDAISKVSWVPPQGENRIATMTSSRSDWCISRQRTWGVPIPAFYHIHSKEPLMNKETINHIKSIIAEKGSDAWWYMPVDELLPEKYRDEAGEYQKGTDTMDVWFDSGSSWAAVLEKRGLNWPADLYLEGTDQHRGWFQSSLLTCIAAKGMAPYKSVLTHGFVLDEKGLKMSKSVGNVIDPAIVIDGGKNTKESPAYGADVLRLWVSSVDYSSDVLIGPQILRQMSDIYRKLRGTLRYLLSNLHDWEPDNAVSYDNLPMIDRHALFQLQNVVSSIKEGYEGYQFYKIFQIIQRFIIVDLSNFYFDVAKDRLYVGGTRSPTRRSCQTVLAAHLLCIVRVIAPILPHLSEDVWQCLPFKFVMADGYLAKFVFEARWPTIDHQWATMPIEDVGFWSNVLELRTEVNKVLETARTGKLIGSSLDAKVEIVSSMEDMSSQDIPYTGHYDTKGGNKIWIGVSSADGSKCERCWHYSTQVGTFAGHPTLCGRCYNVIMENQPQLAAASGTPQNQVRKKA
ncbi:Isoleucine--tRNA ligase [Nymphaea thermarum]|nr:Isoleucine--tRNA ligase [Nymphaea thermarum]